MTVNNQIFSLEQNLNHYIERKIKSKEFFKDQNGNSQNSLYSMFIQVKRCLCLLKSTRSVSTS